MTKVVYKYSINVHMPINAIMPSEFSSLLDDVGFGLRTTDAMAYNISYNHPQGKGFTEEQNEDCRKIIQHGMDEIIKEKDLKGWKLTVQKGVRQDESRD